MLTIKSVLVAAVMAWASVSHAAPSQYSLVYTLEGGGVLAGSLIGELQADGNTIVVDSILDFATFNGVDRPSLPFVESFAEFLGGGAAEPTVSLDGSVMDLIACTSSGCIDGFLFDTSGLVSGGVPEYSSGASFGATSERFAADRWQIQSASVPEPATLALLGLGLAGLGFSRRKH